MVCLSSRERSLFQPEKIMVGRLHTFCRDHYILPTQTSRNETWNSLEINPNICSVWFPPFFGDKFLNNPLFWGKLFPAFFFGSLGFTQPVGWNLKKSKRLRSWSPLQASLQIPSWRSVGWRNLEVPKIPWIQILAVLQGWNHNHLRQP